MYPKVLAPQGLNAVRPALVTGQSPSAGHVICTTPQQPCAALPHSLRSTTPHTPSAPHTRRMMPVKPGTHGADTSVSEGLRSHSPTASQ